MKPPGRSCWISGMRFGQPGWGGLRAAGAAIWKMTLAVAGLRLFARWSSS